MREAIGMLRATSRTELEHLWKILRGFLGALIAVLSSDFIGVGPVVLALSFLAVLFCFTGGLGWYRSARTSASEREISGSSRTQEIDALYRDLRRIERQSSEDPDVAALRKSKLSRLRELQGEEAKAMRERFEAASSWQPEAGLAALREAKRLLGRDEDPASPNSPPLHQG
ncbi:MAG TPA: hypothetical protein VFE33_04020 [Thermoanaerobaculia bacterium]|nr:hypothetical protein [Thermoanaerobaculia bacterium]